MNAYSILETRPEEGYELLDSGEGEKLERFGSVVVARPDPQALWHKRLSAADWNQAQAFFKRDNASARQASATTPSPSLVRRGSDANWSRRGQVPGRWPIDFAGLKFWIKLSAFKHTGLFPEQAPNWEWMQEKIKNQNVKIKIKVLNLFGYTGGATLAAAQAGAEVVHVDGSKVAIGWGKDNAELSGLKDKPIRWILDDALKFVKREIKRGRKYDGIIMDPPAFGHGPGGELWKIERQFPELIEACRGVLSDNPLFVLINGYAAGFSALAYKNNLLEMMGDKGIIEVGELTIAESGGKRLLPCGIFARWSAL